MITVVAALAASRPGVSAAVDMPYQVSRRVLQGELPATLAQDGVRTRGPAPARPLRVRFFADHQFRSSSVHWEDKARALLARLNAFLQPAFGATLEPAGFLKWERSGSADDLEQVLRELVKADAGEGADVVVGLVAPLTLFASSQHQMGEAEIGGKHLVLRGMSDAAEGQGFRSAFDVLDPKELEPILRARVQHRETGVFLHELGHCLGLLHEASADGLMSPSYRRQQAAFTADSASFIARALGFRLQERPDPVAEAKALLQVIEGAKVATWPAADRKQMIERLRFIAGQPAGAPGPATVAPDDEAALLAKAEEQARAKDRAAMLATAWSVRARLLAAEAKAVGMARETPAEATGARVTTSRDLPARLRPDLRAAFPAPAGAAPARPAGPGPVTIPPEAQKIHWARLARLFAFGSALAHAEEALERAGTADPAAEQVRIDLGRMRRRIGLPPGGAGLSPEDEPVYAELFWGISEAIGQRVGKQRPREGFLRELATRYPDVPGAIALRSEIELRAGRTAVGLRLCKEALRLYPETTRALSLLALVDAQAGRRSAAIAGLRQVIDLDPESQGAWRDLAAALRAAKQLRELEELSERYRARFGQALDAAP